MENWFEWIPAFAGMTEPDPRFVSVRPRLFDGQGIFLSLLFDEHQSPSFLRKKAGHSCESRNPKETAIPREKQIEKWRHQWKIELIEKSNPEWAGLYGELV